MGRGILTPPPPATLGEYVAKNGLVVRGLMTGLISPIKSFPLAVKVFSTGTILFSRHISSQPKCTERAHLTKRYSDIIVWSNSPVQCTLVVTKSAWKKFLRVENKFSATGKYLFQVSVDVGRCRTSFRLIGQFRKPGSNRWNFKSICPAALDITTSGFRRARQFSHLGRRRPISDLVPLYWAVPKTYKNSLEFLAYLSGSFRYNYFRFGGRHLCISGIRRYSHD
jgi:hypothetical protein